ncbi:GNAT family N-acetyltransferase [Ascoidea rubescens DSM 1968]|uniref:N-acetyltransferase HPA3 n=1 Tax=Ascoidea rubescens DSM 1968 TaxID=1344418 RepID=A0A1D2VDY0_9ASCO|nr:N-acetyltransferase HPA3 [Ascoidea rubescens DSM 1968]ODV59677.1 N-acetyltransferase HPA3 [Ascoidea rubescens DSM 1968]
MSEFYIRPIEETDKDEWLELWSGKHGYLEFYKTILSPKTSDATFKRFFDSDYTMWCAVAISKQTQKLIGFTTYLTHLSTWSENNYMYLNDLFVKEDCRLKGVGRKLIEFVYRQAELKKSEKVYWCTQTFNHRAQILYNKVGIYENFVQYAKDPDYKIEE